MIKKSYQRFDSTTPASPVLLSDTKTVDLILRFLAYFVGSMGAIVILGWLCHLPRLIQLYPSFPPMQFNAALSFCILSIGFFLLQKKKLRWASFLSLLIVGFSAATFSQYLLGINLKIDQFFIECYMPAVPAHPGRMAPNAALCFMLSGLALWTMSKKTVARFEFLSAFSGIAIICFALLALLNFAVQIPNQYGWGNFSSMSLLTAINFILIGIMITIQSLGLLVKKGFVWNNAIPVFVSASALTAVVALWQASLQYQTSEIQKTTETKAEAIRDQIVQGLEDRIKSIERMANHLEMIPKMPESAWQSDASLYLKDLAVLELLSVIDANKRLKWLEPKNAKLIGYDISQDAFRNHYFDEARLGHKTVLTPVTALKQGGRGFILIVPMFKEGGITGYVAGSIRPEKFIHYVLNLRDYEISLTAGRENLFSSLTQPQEFLSQWAVQMPLQLHGEDLTLLVTPTLDTIRDMESTFPYMILIVGVFISLLLGMMIHFATTLRLQSGVLKEQRNFLDTVIDSSPLGIIILDNDHRIKIWSHSCETMFGWSMEEVMGQLLPFVPESRRAGSTEFIDRVLKSGNLAEADLKRVKRNGAEIDVRVTALPLRSEDKTYGLMAVVEDVTDQRIAQQEILTAREVAEKAAASKTEFLANMSHEIRTPLNGIIGMSDLLLDTSLEGEQKRYANIIQSSATTLLTLINDILDLSKIEAGKMLLESLDFSLTSVVETQVEILMIKAREKNLSLATFISPDLPRTIRADPGRISQVILNLLGNAIKFSHAGGVLLRVVESKEKSEGTRVFIRFEVQDTGIGLSNEAQEKLFKPFSQVDGSTARKYGGTGLGLSISKNLVEGMNGRIGIESEAGKGSVFWFEIPVIATLGSVRKIEQDRNRRILVVDSDPIALEVIQRYTSAWKMNAECISDQSLAIEKIQTAEQSGRPYHLVLMSSAHLGLEMKQKFKDTPPHMILMLDFEKAQNEESKKGVFAEVINKPLKQSQLYDSIIRQGSAPAEADSSVSTRPLEFKKKHGRILVADDVAPNQLLALKLLEKLGYDAQAVGNGKEVLETIEKGKFDLILMDCQMPEMDGFEATRLIRQLKDPKLSNIPIIALTANALDGDDKACIDAGMNDYISKPFKRERLGEVIEKWLEPSSSKSTSSLG